MLRALEVDVRIPRLLSKIEAVWVLCGGAHVQGTHPRGNPVHSVVPILAAIRADAFISTMLRIVKIFGREFAY